VFAIKRAIVKSYDAGAHKADVQIGGSLGVWLDGVRVATNIPAADVVPGRQCSVLFFDPSNQDDALVLTIQGAPPSGGGGVTDHGMLTGLGDDDHSQYGALAQAETWTALQTFNAGVRLAAGQQIEDSGGNGRVLVATASPHVTLTGETRINSRAGIDSAPSSSPDAKLTISPTADGVTDWRGLQIIPSLTLSGNSRVAYGIFGSANVIVPASSSGHRVYGLDFVATGIAGGAAASAAELTACAARPGVVAIGTGKSLSVTDYRAFAADFNILTVIFATATLTNVYGLHLKGAAMNNSNLTITNLYGLRVEDFTGTSIGNSYLMEIGPSTPYLRLAGGGNPGANMTNLHLNENGTLRRVQWKAGDALGAGDRVMVLV
jgi:hypothetical protein